MRESLWLAIKLRANLSTCTRHRTLWMRRGSCCARMRRYLVMTLKKIGYTLRFCSGVAVLSGAVALAQAPTSPQQQQPTMPSQQPGANSANPGMGSGAYPGTAPTGQDFAEKTFVTKALEGGDMEVQLGQLAQQKSQSNDVKQFAQKMVSDHSQMADKWFKPIAQQLGVPEPKGPSKKDKKEIAR